MKTKFYVRIAALVLLLGTLLSACSPAFTCDLCNRKSRGKQYNLTGWGRGYVCETCYDSLCGRG